MTATTRREILRGRRAITPDTALWLSRWLSISAEFWLNHQRAHDLEVARAEHGAEIERTVTPRTPSPVSSSS